MQESFQLFKQLNNMPIKEIRLSETVNNIIQLFKEFFVYLSYSIMDEDTFYITMVNTVPSIKQF